MYTLMTRHCFNIILNKISSFRKEALYKEQMFNMAREQSELMHSHHMTLGPLQSFIFSRSGFQETMLTLSKIKHCLDVGSLF